MNEELKPYSEYKESGTEWLGRVPKHWHIVPNRALFVEVRDRDQPDAEMLSVTITRGVVPQSSVLAESSKKDSSNQDRSAYKVVRPGDIVYNKMRAWQGALGVSRVTGIVSPAYVVMRPRAAAVSQYFHELFRTPGFAQEAERWSYGITSDMWSLRPEHFRLIYSTCPPPEEQAAIVKYLDQVDRKINRYIRTKKKLISVLNEQKRAVIHHAVTRGLDGFVKLKPSCIYGIPEIPVHWNRTRLGMQLRSIEQGWSPSAAEGEIADDQWCVLTLSAIKRGRFRPKALKPIPTTAAVPHNLELVDGDLLLTRSNTRELVGDTCVVEGVRAKTIMSDLIYRLRVNEKRLDPYFAMYSILSPNVRRQIARDARGSSGTMPKIAHRHIKGWELALPPIGEQKRIAAQLALRLSEVIAAEDSVEREIELLREYRTRLISDVVTGKLDIREAAAELPDNADGQTDPPLNTDAETDEISDDTIADAAE